MLGYSTTVDIFVQMKIAAIHLADLAPGSFDNHPRGSQVLIRLIGNDRSICPTLGHIAYVGGGATQISYFTGKFTIVMLMESRKGQ